MVNITKLVTYDNLTEEEKEALRKKSLLPTNDIIFHYLFGQTR